MAIYFDVGANDGSSTERYAHAGNWVLMFEPNPEMLSILKKKEEINPNITVFPFAISDYDGFAKFNVCVTHDRGCSSLLDISEAGKTQWGGRTDMIPHHQINVPVAKLETIMMWDRIPEIEFFHCDTQGSDLKVLKGMGKYLNRIKQGVVEVAAKPDILYKGQNGLEETKAFLENNGFKVVGAEPNDVQQNEFNLHFVRI